MANVSGVQYDPQGRPYILYPDGSGRKSYISPVAFGAQAPTGSSFMHSPPQWNADSGQWETPFDWGKLATIGTAGVLGASALSAVGAFGGGAGAESGVGSGVGPVAAGSGTTSAAVPSSLATLVSGGAPSFASRLLANPMLIPSLGSTLGGVFTNIYAANKSADAARQAAELQAQASDKQLAYLREQAAQQQANWEKTQQFNTDIFNRRQAALAPYTNMGAAAMTTLANLIGGPAMVQAARQQPNPVSFPFASTLPGGAPPAASPRQPTTLQTLIR